MRSGGLRFIGDARGLRQHDQWLDDLTVDTRRQGQVVTGIPGRHATTSNVTTLVAVVSDVLVHPSGSVAGHPTPAGSNVAVTVTDCPAT